MNLLGRRRAAPAPPLPAFSGAQSVPVKTFLALAELRMSSEPAYYTTPARRIAYVSAAFTGRARLWVAHQYAETRGAAPMFKSYTEFARLLAAYFAARGPLGAVVHCRQTSSVGEYAARWRAAVAALNQDIRRESEVLRFSEDADGRLRREVLQRRGGGVAVDDRYWRQWWALGLGEGVREGVLETFQMRGSFADLVRRAEAVEHGGYPGEKEGRDRGEGERERRRTVLSWVSERAGRDSPSDRRRNGFVPDCRRASGFAPAISERRFSTYTPAASDKRYSSFTPDPDRRFSTYGPDPELLSDFAPQMEPSDRRYSSLTPHTASDKRLSGLAPDTPRSGGGKRQKLRDVFSRSRRKRERAEAYAAGGRKSSETIPLLARAGWAGGRYGAGVAQPPRFTSRR